MCNSIKIVLFGEDVFFIGNFDKDKGYNTILCVCIRNKNVSEWYIGV